MTLKNLLYIALTFVLLCFNSSSIAGECLTQSPWKGKIGEIPVTMEFSEVSFSDTSKGDVINGKYYYKNATSDLILKQNKSLNGWDEYNNKNEVTGHIENYKCEGNLLTAQWKSKDGKTTLQLKANKTEDYSKNRLDNVKFTFMPKKFNQRNYKILSIPNIISTGLLLVDNTPSIEKINQLLKKDYIKQIYIDLDCISSGKLQDQDFESESHSSIAEWNNAYVTISSSGSDYCGGAHPNYYHSTSVFNLTTGELEKTSSWFEAPYNMGDGHISKESILGKLLSKNYVKQRLKGAKSKVDVDEAEDCLSDIEFYTSGSWTKENKIFLQTDAPHVATACIEDIALTYKEAEPFLSPIGKSAMQASVK